MLTEKGIADIQSFLPLIDNESLSEVTESPNISDREIQDFISRYTNRFTSEESLEALKGLSNGVTFEQLNYCADVCNKLKENCQDSSELVHGFDETVRLYCIAFESDETVFNHRHLDDMVQAMRLVQQFASMYQEDNENVYLIQNPDELWSFPLTPDGYMTSLVPFASDHDIPIIPTSYYINLKDMQITGKITPSVLWNTKHSKDKEPFLFRQYQSLGQIIDMLEDSLSIEPLYEDLFMARPEEQSKGFLQYCERSGKHFGNLLATPAGIKHADELPAIGVYGLANTARVKVHAIEYGINDRILVSIWTVDGYPIGGAEWRDIQCDEDGHEYIEYGGDHIYTNEIISV